MEVKVSKVETVKVDKRKSNPGRPVNKKSARYIRLQKQVINLRISSSDFLVISLIDAIIQEINLLQHLLMIKHYGIFSYFFLILMFFF